MSLIKLMINTHSIKIDTGMVYPSLGLDEVSFKHQNHSSYVHCIKSSMCENSVGLSSTTNPKPKGATIPLPALIPAQGRATLMPSLEN